MIFTIIWNNNYSFFFHSKMWNVRSTQYTHTQFIVQWLSKRFPIGFKRRGERKEEATHKRSLEKEMHHLSIIFHFWSIGGHFSLHVNVIYNKKWVIFLSKLLVPIWACCRPLLFIICSRCFLHCLRSNIVKSFHANAQ